VPVLLAQDLDRFDNPSGRTALEEVSVWSDEICGTCAARRALAQRQQGICGTVSVLPARRGHSSARPEREILTAG
jgi:hypothetical protein